MGKVEPQAIRRYRRAVLFDVRPQQRVNNAACTRWVAVWLRAASCLVRGFTEKLQPFARTDRNPTSPRPYGQSTSALVWFLGANLHATIGPSQHALIAGLAAAFRIKWRDIEHSSISSPSWASDQAITLKERLHHAFGIHRSCRQTLWFRPSRHVAEDQPRRFMLKPPVFWRVSAALRWRFKAGFVEGDPLLTAGFRNEVHREPITCRTI